MIGEVFNDATRSWSSTLLNAETAAQTAAISELFMPASNMCSGQFKRYIKKSELIYFTYLYANISLLTSFVVRIRTREILNGFWDFD